MVICSKLVFNFLLKYIKIYCVNNNDNNNEIKNNSNKLLITIIYGFLL